MTVSPTVSFEPITQPKFLILTCLASIALLRIFKIRNLINLKNNRTYVFSLLFYIFLLCSVFIFSQQPRTKQLFGVEGRGLGLITYLSLTIIFIFVSLSTTFGLISITLKAIQVIGVISAVIGIFQMIGLNIFTGSDLNYGLVVGLLGNPNFQSALLGMSFIVYLRNILHSKGQQKSLLFQATLILIALYGSNSMQGYFIAIIGILIFLFYIFYEKNYLKTLYILLTTTLLSLIYTIFGLLGKGFLSPYFYQASNIYRGDYWRAAGRMIIENPVLGLGFDSYRDNYRLFRDTYATNRRGPDAITDSPHNFLLEAGVNGGVSLMIFNLVLIFVLVVTFLINFKKIKTHKLDLVCLFSLWLAFIAQATISPGNIAILMLGWTLSGLILGLKINLKNLESSTTYQNKFKLKNYRIIISGILIGIFIAGPNFYSDARFMSALKSKELKKIVSSAYMWPRDEFRMARVIKSLNENGFYTEALDLARVATKNFPKTFEIWREFYQIPTLTLEEKKIILSTMREIDPNNINLSRALNKS
jgi:O-antigen ligase